MINEALTKEENKALFRELVKKYHPDAGGDPEIMKKLNASRNSDSEFEKFVNELIGKKTNRPVSTMSEKENLEARVRNINGFLKSSFPIKHLHFNVFINKINSSITVVVCLEKILGTKEITIKNVENMSLGEITRIVDNFLQRRES